MDGKEKKYRILWGAVGVLMFLSIIVMYKTHRVVPFMMDDLWYSTKLSSEEPITNLKDIIESQIWHYFNWGGRSMTHGILQLTLLAGEQAADILNVAVTLLLGWVICLTAGVDSRKEKKFLKKLFPERFFGLWAAVSMLIGFNANWKMSMFWQAGAANYLYITVFILLFLWCYLREVPDEGINAKEQNFSEGTRRIGVKISKCVSAETEENSNISASKSAGIKTMDKSGSKAIDKLPGITFWVIPLGILAGWSNENMGPAVWLISLAVMFMTVKEHRQIKPWMVLGNLSCLFGSIMVVVAPGNFVRGAQVPENQYGILWRIFLRCYGESKSAMEYLFPVLLCLVMTLLISKGVLGLSVGRKNLLLLFCALLSWGAMILSPHYPDRATFGTMALLICVILSMWQKALRERENLLWAAFGIGALVWLRGMFFLGEFLAIFWGWIR